MRSTIVLATGAGLVTLGLVVGLLILLRTPVPVPEVVARDDAGSSPVRTRPAPPTVVSAAPAAPAALPAPAARPPVRAVAEGRTTLVRMPEESTPRGEEPPREPPQKKWNELFAAENRDSEWAPATEDLIRSAISNDILGSAFTPPTVECRATMCQVKSSAAFDTVDGAKAQMRRWQAAVRAIDERPENGVETIGSTFTAGKDGVRIDYVSTVQRRQ